MLSGVGGGSVAFTTKSGPYQTKQWVWSFKDNYYGLGHCEGEVGELGDEKPELGPGAIGPGLGLVEQEVQG